MSRISQIVATAADIESEEVSVPEWGLTLLVKGMDGIGRSEYLTRLIAAREDQDSNAIAEVEAALVVACVFDPEDGTQAFDASDADMLTRKSGAVVGRIAGVAMRLNGLDAKAEERLGKSSSESPISTPADSPTDTTPSDVSTSPSPAS